MTEIKEQLSQLNKMSNKSEALYHKVAFSIGISDSSLGVPNKALLAKRILLCSLFAGKETG